MQSAPQSPTTQASHIEPFPVIQSSQVQDGISTDIGSHRHASFGSGDGRASSPGTRRTSGTSSQGSGSDETSNANEDKAIQNGQILSPFHSPESKGKSVSKKYRRPDAKGATYLTKLPNGTGHYHHFFNDKANVYV